MSAAVLACFSLSRRTWPAKLCYACILRSWRPLWTSWIACGLSSTVLATVLDADDTTPSVLVSAVLCSSTAPTVVVATRVRRAAPTGDTENRRPTVRTSERPCSRIWKHSDVCSWSASDGFIRRFVEQSVECFQKQMQRFWAHGYVQKHAYAKGFNHSRHSDSSTHPQHMSSTHHKQCSQGPLPPARDLVDKWPCAPPKGPRTAHSYAKSRSSARILRSVFAINSPVSNPQHQNIMTSTSGKSPKPFPSTALAKETPSGGVERLTSSSLHTLPAGDATQRRLSFKKSSSFTRFQLWRWRTMRNGLCIHHLKVSIQRAQQREEAVPEEAEPEHQGRAEHQTARVTTTPRPRISLRQVLSAKKVAAKAKKQIASTLAEKVQEMQCDIDSLRAMVQTIVKHLDSSALEQGGAETCGQVQDNIPQSISSQNDTKKRTRECPAPEGPNRRRRSLAEGLAIRIPAPHPPPQAPTAERPTQRYLPGIGCAIVWEKQGKAVRVKEGVWQQARVELE